MYTLFRELRYFLNRFSISLRLSKKILVLSIVTGIVTGLGSSLFNYTLDKGIEIFDRFVRVLPDPRLIFIVPAIGGLIVGLMKYYGKMSFDSPCSTDAMIDAIKEGGYVPFRIPFLQLITASITIGSGGSCGRECPTAYMGTGFGSISYDVVRFLRLHKIFKFRLTLKDRRLLGICGAAAGLGAIFRAPVGSSIFATEVLYKYGIEFTAILPALISAVISYLIFSMIFPYEPLFRMKAAWSFGFSGIVFALITGISSAVFGWIYVKVFYGVYRYSRRNKLPDWVKPAIGGLLEGLIVAFIAKEVWGMGYDVIQKAIDGRFAISFMLLLIFAKIVATSFTVATGGSGGVIAPSLFIGAMMGALLGKVFMAITHQAGSVGIYSVVGMASLYAAVGKVPIALPILLLEATRNFSLIIPLFIATSIGYLFSGPFTLYESQSPFLTKENLALDIAGENELDVLEPYKVKRIMTVDVETIREDARLSEVIETFKNSSHVFFPVVSNGNKYVGTISLDDIRPILLEEKELDPLLVARDIANKSTPCLDPNMSLREAYEIMRAKGFERLPVVDSKKGELVGVLTYNDLLRFLERQILFLTGEGVESLSFT